MTLWRDEIGCHGDLLTYESRAKIRSKKPSSKERLANLRWARDNCDGLVRVVIVTAKDVKAERRSIADCFPVDQLVMRITHLDDETGAFRMESVTKYPMDWLAPSDAGVIIAAAEGFAVAVGRVHVRSCALDN
jgi:hypothetical protein